MTRGGRVAVILLLVFALLAAIGAGAYVFLRPYLRYRAAVQAQLSGDYDRAMKLYAELGDYKDSAQRAADSVIEKAVDQINKGGYEDALTVLEAQEGYEEEKAKCYYSLAVLAHNEGNLDKAWAYIEKLKAVAPDYPELPTLEKSCYYASGLNCYHTGAEETRSQQRIEQYKQAVHYFQLSENYENSEDWIVKCKYLIALEESEMADASGAVATHLQNAIDYFSEIVEYQDSAARLQECEFRYAVYYLEEVGVEQDTAMGYLEDLAESGYPGAQELYDRVTGAGFSFFVTVGPAADDPLPEEESDLTQLYIHFSVSARSSDGVVVPVLLHVLLPDDTPGSAFLNPDGESDGTVAWKDIFPTECKRSGPVVMSLYDIQRSDLPVVTDSFEYVYVPAEEGQGN